MIFNIHHLVFKNVHHTLYIAAATPFYRTSSTWNFNTSVQRLSDELQKTQPRFSIPARRIKVLRRPTEFYDLLKDMIQRAERRIFLSSLYVGSNEAELIEKIVVSLRERPSLQLYMLLDLNRSTRPGSDSTARLLLPLLREFPERVHISLFRSPNLRGLLAKLVPPRFNEGWGTWHAKIYGVDDEVLITGANLNESYFTNRQDRYIHFKNPNPALAQYCFEFMQLAATFSYTLLPPTTSNHLQDLSRYSYHQEDYVLSWPDPATHPHHIHTKAESALRSFQSAYHKVTDADTKPCPPGSVLLYPIIQAGQFNIREEENVLRLLFSVFSSGNPKERPTVDFTTGYFGLFEDYQDLILTSDVNTRLVIASPKANGFFGSSGISGRIPEGYTHLEQRFVKAVTLAGRLWNGDEHSGDAYVRLEEWEKNGWTYHAKGLWLSPKSDTLPSITLFGSTNLNSRSAHIDTELSFLLICPPTPDADVKETAGDEDTEGENNGDVLQLRRDFKDELDNIRSSTTRWKGQEREVRLGTKFLIWLVGSML